MTIHTGDIVARNSYQCDVYFRVAKIDEVQNVVELSGEDYRLYADAPINDLRLVSDQERKEHKARYRKLENESTRLFRQDYQRVKAKLEYTSTSGYRSRHQFFEIPGRVLHIDGDANYLKKCLRVYEKIGVPVIGKHVKETEMPQVVPGMIRQVRPDILVLTGHDAYIKSKGDKYDLKAYRHSPHFIRTVKEVRSLNPDLDQLVIFAGACQSYFERIIRAGANFASAPKRVNIHALDPVYIVAKVSFTPFMDRVNVWEALQSTVAGTDGLGGVETRGILRTGMPYNQPN